MTSELELKALEILNKEAQNGHTALPESRLIQALCIATGRREDDLLTAIERSDVITTRVTKNNTIMRASLKNNMLEKQAVEQIERLIKSFAKKPTFKKLSRTDMRLGKSILPSDEQIAAVNSALGSAVSVITGGPGTGKTTMILGLVRAIKSLDLNVTLCAPTGKAAKRLGEATGLQKFKPSTVHRYLRSPYSEVNVIIVDEASMLDINLFNMLISTIPDGCQLILIGDKDQLPPVASGQPFKDIIQWIDHTGATTKAETEVKLDSAVNGIVSTAYAVNEGKDPNKNFNLDKDNFEFIECSQDSILKTVLEYYFNKLPKALNRDFESCKNEIQILTPQNNGTLGTKNINLEIQKMVSNKGRSLAGIVSANSKRERVRSNPLVERDRYDIQFYAGDRVMQKANDYDVRVMNGETGSVVSSSKEGYLNIAFDENIVTYNADQIQNLELAYAISIHKSQGSEYAGVIIPVTSEHSFMLSRNLLYTAITRGKSKVCVIGERASFLKAIKEGFKGFRYTGLQLELDLRTLANSISLSRLTDVYRQK